MDYVIERLGHQGDGIASGPVYAPRTLPGEVVTGALDGDRLTAIRIVTPSDDRVAAPCRHYKSCGGCAVQHASDAFVADWKTDQVRRALDAHGVSAQFEPIQTSPPWSRRRATFAARRTKTGALVGFHGRASDVITPVPDCHLVDPMVAKALPLAERLAIDGASRKGVLSVSVTASDSGLDVSVSGGKTPDGPFQARLAAMAEAHDLARLTWNTEVIVTRRAPFQRFGDAVVVPPPGAFLQATAHGQSALTAAVLDALGSARRVVDLFSGCGTFALPVAARAQVHAVETDQGMLAALEQGWRGTQGLHRMTTEARDLFRNPLVGDDLRPFDAAVIDPPRAGADAQMVALADARIPRIAAVSCNPVTFARDARILVDAGYQIDRLHIVDQFRWSTHVELAACLTLSH